MHARGGERGPAPILRPARRVTDPPNVIERGEKVFLPPALVFQGDNEGFITGYDAVDGRQLWRFNAGLGIIAPPISYRWRGVQYVSILVGCLWKDQPAKRMPS